MPDPFFLLTKNIAMTNTLRHLDLNRVILYAALCIWSFGFTCSVSASDDVAMKEKDGVRLMARQFDGASKGESGGVMCELLNSTDRPLQYDINGYNLGFRFEMVDHQGQRIPQNKPWAKRNNPAPMGAHVPGRVNPSQKLTYKLSLEEAYGRGWMEGARLTIRWEPGLDPSGNLLLPGSGLQVVLAIGTPNAKNVSVPLKSMPISTNSDFKQRTAIGLFALGGTAVVIVISLIFKNMRSRRF